VFCALDGEEAEAGGIGENEMVSVDGMDAKKESPYSIGTR
jgi:hypothetical protein